MKNITFINAGAGSGKTYRLTTDLARMLTQEGLDPSQVILTTYTELAAAEFREKARKEILCAKDEDGNPTPADIRINSATQLDNAFIGTVHAISFRFIRKYWYLLNYGTDIQPMSDQNQDFYMSQSISNIVTKEDHNVFRQFRETFDIKDEHSHPHHLFWLPELKNIVDKMEYYDVRTIDESIRKSKETVEKIFTGMAEKDALSIINKYLLLLKERCEGITTGRSAEKAKRYADTIKEAYPVKTLSGLTTTNMKECIEKKIGTATDAFYQSREYLNAQEAYKQIFISQDLLTVVNPYIETIFNLAKRWQEALLRYKQENHIISFDDMEKIFLSMLTEPQYKEVQDDIEKNIRLLMVDEFQDSNPVQLKIFNRISDLIARNGGHSIWVGDPKQAIYSFRGSDSSFISGILGKFTFSDDGNAIPEQGNDMLGTDQLLESWRSRPSLVTFANSIFLQPFLDEGLKEKQITLKPHHTTETDTMGANPSLYVWRTEQENNKHRASMLARQIKAMLESGCHVHHHECNKPASPITYRDIAVLCYSNSECNTVASALREIGLPASCEETNLMQCLEVYLLKTILLSIQYPGNKMLRAELAMMLDDATTEDILNDRIQYVNKHYDKDDKSWDRWMDSDSRHKSAETIARLAELTTRYQNLSIYDAVVAIHEGLDLNNIIEKWGDATQRRHNLSTVVNMAKTYDDICLQMGIGSSILGFINYLTVTKPENKTDNSSNTVKVLTYHRSKGLEWPVVILYQLWKDLSDENNLVKQQFCDVNVCEIEDQDTDIFGRNHYINLFPHGINGSGKLPGLMQETIVQQPLYSTISKRASGEALRLLYVGVTRAKDILVALTSKKKAKDGGEDPSLWPQNLGIGNGSSLHPFGDGHNETLLELVESIEGQEDDTAATPKYCHATNTPAINNAPLASLTPSTLESFDDPFTQNVQVAAAEERIIDMKMFAGEPSDAIKGSCIHDIFAAYKPGDKEGNLHRTTSTLAEYGFPNALQANKERVLRSIKWLHEYLESTYGPATHIEKETPILYQLPNGQTLRGEIDLLWYYQAEDGQEKCILIDYKTFPGRNDELEHHTERYYPQLSAYHAALTASGATVTDTLIYYPVQAHIRKLTK